MYSLLGPCLFDKKIIKRIKKVSSNYERVGFLFDVISYLKLRNDVTVMKKKIFNDTQIKWYFSNYVYELPSLGENNIFDFSIEKYK